MRATNGRPYILVGSASYAVGASNARPYIVIASADKDALAGSDGFAVLSAAS